MDRAWLKNPGVSVEHILEPHCETTVGCCRTGPVILAMQDTTGVNCTSLDSTGGQGDVGGGDGSTGILEHAEDLKKCLVTAAHVADPGRLAGSHPASRQQLPGTKMAWLGLERPNRATQMRDAIGTRRRK